MVSGVRDWGSVRCDIRGWVGELGEVLFLGEGPQNDVYGRGSGEYAVAVLKRSPGTTHVLTFRVFVQTLKSRSQISSGRERCCGQKGEQRASTFWHEYRASSLVVISAKSLVKSGLELRSTNFSICSRLSCQSLDLTQQLFKEATSADISCASHFGSRGDFSFLNPSH